MNGLDLSVGVAAVDAFHLVVPEGTYWSTYRPDNRSRSERFELKPGWRTVYARRVESALVRVTLTDGHVGWGEATEPIMPELVGQLVTRLIAPMMRGETFADPAALWDFGYDLNRGRGHHSGYQLLALAALDVAVWDALGQRHDLPVAALMTEAPRQVQPVYLSGIRRGTIDERVELMRRYRDEGLQGAKIFVGGDTAATLREVDALRAGVAGDWALMVDALWSYDRVADAAALKQALESRRVSWLECPLVPEDLEAHARLVAAPGVPIALGEHFFTHYQTAPWLRARALQILQPDICRSGLSDGWRQRVDAVSNGVRVTAHMGSGSPIVQAAALQFNAASGRAGDGDLLAEMQLDLADAMPTAFDSAWRCVGGTVSLPDRPGLGVAVDLEALAAHCPSVLRWRADEI